MAARSLPPPLPIDPHLPAIVAALPPGRNLVLVAEPGAGKTTRVPSALLQAGLAARGEIVVLEPRRLATRLAARRVAEELGEPLGERVGFTVRFDDVSGPATRLRFVTEGVLSRRLASNPHLDGVAAVVLDEFHERHLHGDLALALCRRLQQGPRPDLALLVMSATLDAAPLADFLDAPLLRVAGRPFEVAIEYAGRDSDRPLHEQVIGAVLRLAREEASGDILVFLPGAAEIRRAEAALSGWGRDSGALVVPLHGDLPLEAQERAVRRSDRRKVILSTNVAETSLTIDGVTAVVDSGLARVARHSPWSGLPSLVTAKVSRASAIQRAGRAGRQGPGRCLRLYTRGDHDARPAHDVAEIRRADLTETVLLLRALGERDLARFPWFEAPPAAALAAADELLVRLGAIAAPSQSEAGAPTALGARLLRLPLHPRLGRLVIEAEARGEGVRGGLLAALLSERDIVAAARTRFGGGAARAASSGPSDLLDRLDAFELAEVDRLRGDRLREAGLDPGAVQAVGRARDQIARALRSQSAVRRGVPGAGVAERAAASDRALLIATLAGFPDRVAKRRAPRSHELVFAGGGAAKIAETSVVRDPELVVVVDADEHQGSVVARRVSAIEADWLLDLFPDRIRERDELLFDAATERVERRTLMLYDGLVLDEDRRPAPPSPAAAQLLAAAARAAGISRLWDIEKLDHLRARARHVAHQRPSFPPLDDPALDDALVAASLACTRFAELRERDLGADLLARLPAEERAALARLAPDHVALPGGRRLAVHYEVDRPPWIQSRLQDFFGLRDGPRLGSEPLVLHLLAPNQRAVQVTTDLAGFWARHYPALRRELMRRYPRHAWPDDPLAALPPAPGRR